MMQSPAKLLQQLTEIVQPEKAWFLSEKSVLVSSKQKRLSLGKKRSKCQFFELACCSDEKWTNFPFPLESQRNVEIFPSPSRKRLCLVRKIVDPEKPEEEPDSEIQVITSLGCGYRYGKAIRTHRIRPSGQLGGLSWNWDESEIAFVAARKKPTSKPYVQQQSTENEIDNIDIARGREFDFHETWGEQMGNLRSTDLYTFNIKDEVVTPVSNVPDRVSVESPVFCRDGGLIYVAYEETWPRLGMIYYSTRRSHLYYTDSTSENKHVDLVPEYHSPKCPQFSPDGSRLAFLTTDKVETHHAPQKLIVLIWQRLDSTKSYVVVDIPYYEPKAGFNNGGFAGLWGLNECNHWVSNLEIVFTAPCGFSKKLFKVTLNEENKVSGSLEEVKISAPFWHPYVSLLDVWSNHLLLKISHPSMIPSVFYYNLTTGILNRLTATNPNTPAVKCDVFDVLRGDETIEAMLVQPKMEQQQRKLLLWLHGGPHSANRLEYNQNLALLVKIGYSVLHVNYRGSAHYSDSFLKSLPGKIGRQDVHDCIAAVDNAMDMLSIEAGTKVGVLGGSHGGFLTGHLIGQFPYRFAVASMRNPVLNLNYMAACSDILDWIYTEMCFKFDCKKGLTVDQARILHESSPIYHIEKVETPVLLQVGLKDARVPVEQSREYYRKLRARGVPVRLQEYPSCAHTLADDVYEEADVWLNKVEWMLKYYPI